MADHSVSHRQVFQFLWKHLKGHFGVLILMISTMLVGTALSLAQPFFYRDVVDIIAEGRVGDRAALSIALLKILIGVACGVGTLTLHEFGSFLNGRVQSSILPEIHRHVFAHVQRLSTRFHINTFAGATARKIGRGVDGAEDLIDKLWFNFIPLFVFTVGLVIVLASFAPEIGIAMVIGMILYIVIATFLNLKAAKLFSWTDEQDTEVTASLVDSITGNAVVKAFGAEDREVIRHGDALTEWGKRVRKAWGFSAFVTWVQFMVLMAIELAVFSLTVWLWFRGQFGAGAFVVAMFYIGQLWGRMFDVGQQIRQYIRSKVYAEEMVGLLQEHVEVDDHQDASDLVVQSGSIAFDSVTFRYEDQLKPVFEDFSVKIEPGEKIALVGHSGGGKTSFVKLLLRLYDLESGQILIDDHDIASVTQQSLRKAVALVPQDPILFHRSLAENISYAKQDASFEEIERAAKLAHADEFIRTLPLGYDTLVGERGVKLSGGERQRVAIARAILADAPILVLDEATSSLDSQSEAYIQEALEYLMKGRTSIVIAHRLSTIKKADRIFVVEGGTIVEEGSHSELVKKDGGVYRGFFEQQAGGFIGE